MKITRTLPKLSDTREYILVKFAALVSEIKMRSKEFLWNYQPNDKQKIFHNSKKKIRFFIGGNQSGKTLGAILWESTALALGEHPHVDASNVGGKIWIVALDKQNMIKNNLIPRYLENVYQTKDNAIPAIPKRYIKQYYVNDGVIELTNGWTIEFKSIETTGGESKFQSAIVDAVFFDEEPPDRNIFKECLMRIAAKRGFIVFAMTPTHGAGTWTHEDFYKPYMEAIKNGTPTNQNVEIVECSTYDNKHLSTEQLELIASEYKTEEERQMRFYGKYVAMEAGIVFQGLMSDPITIDIKQPRLICDTLTMENGSIKTITDDYVNKNVKIWEEYNPREMYVAGLDCTEGVHDRTALIIFKLGTVDENKNGKIITHDTLIQVAEYAETSPPEYSVEKTYEILMLYHSPFLNIERNGGASAFITVFMKKGYSNFYFRETVDNAKISDTLISTEIGTYMSGTTRGSKHRMVTQLRQLMTDKGIVIHSEATKMELAAYVQTKRGEYKASYGFDDLVVATMLAVEGYLSAQTPIRRTDELTKGERNAIESYAERTDEYISY